MYAMCAARKSLRELVLRRSGVLQGLVNPSRTTQRRVPPYLVTAEEPRYRGSNPVKIREFDEMLRSRLRAHRQSHLASATRMSRTRHSSRTRSQGRHASGREAPAFADDSGILVPRWRRARRASAGTLKRRRPVPRNQMRHNLKLLAALEAPDRSAHYYVSSCSFATLRSRAPDRRSRWHGEVVWMLVALTASGRSYFYLPRFRPHCRGSRNAKTPSHRQALRQLVARRARHHCNWGGGRLP